MVSAPLLLAGASRSRVSRRVVRSAPARISLNKESILKMTRTEARATLRATTPMTFYKMGRQRGLVLWALLLIMATQPTQAFLNHAAAAGAVPPSAPAKPKHWYEAFKGREVGTAMQLARQATQIAAARTGSGTAVVAVTASQYASTTLGQYIIALVAVTFFVKQILDYGKARMNRQTAKNQMALMDRQMAQQQRMLEMMLEAQLQPRRRGTRTPALPSANRIALPAIMAS